MAKSYLRLQRELHFDELTRWLDGEFQAILDHRAKNASYAGNRVACCGGMEATFYESEELDETGIGKAARMEVGHERTRSVVERGSIASERSVPEILL